MLDELLTNTTLSPTLITAFVVCAVVFFCLGWFGKGKGAHAREKQLKRDILESKRSIPQLESVVRNREAQVGRLEMDLKDLNERTTGLQRAHDAKEKELRGSSRELKNLTSELAAVKGHSTDADNFIMDGFDDEVAAENDGGSALATKLKTTEKLYQKLKTALIKRDARIESLENSLAEGSGAGAQLAEESFDLDDADEDSHGATRELQQTIADRDLTIKALQSEVTELRNEKGMLEDLANRRSKSNRALKDASAEAKSRLPELEREITDREKTIFDREASITRLLAEQEVTKKELAQQIAQTNTLEAELGFSGQQLEISNNKLNELEASLNQREERITVLDRELTTSNEAIADIRDQLQASKESIDAQKIAFETESATLQKQAQAANTLSSTIKDRDFKISSLEGDISELQESLSNAREDATDTSAITEKRQEVAASEVSDSQSQLAALRREVEDLRANLTQREQWMEKLKESLNERESRLQQLQTRNEALTRELQGANELVKTQETARHDLEAQKHDFETQIVSHKAKAQQAEAALEEQTQSIKVFKSMIADRDFKIESLEGDLLASAAKSGNGAADTGQPAA